MHLKRFKGKAVSEVMRQVRDELGPEAVILHTRPSRPWGPLRFIHGTGVEILAAVGRLEVRSADPARPSPPSTVEVRTELRELRDLVIRLAGGRLLAPAGADLHDRLVAAGVDSPLAYRIVAGAVGAQTDDPADASAALEARLAEMIPASPPPAGDGAVVALVGPTGSGKTTTLAKLAAIARIRRNAPEIVSLDGESLGGRRHLEAVAAILDCPYELALARSDLERLAADRRGSGLVLIDTPGLSPADSGARERVAAMLGPLVDRLGGGRPREVHLVLSATAKPADALTAVRAFGPLGVTHLCFTRLDETASPGSLLTVAAEAGLPLSFFGTGREVPDDIRVASPSDLARRILHGR